MGKIQVLPEAVISRIAAGEVVERPASVVRELMDNSLDAGSRKIVIEVQEGGRTLIKVTDDGGGISQAEVPLAFQRHATSKVRHENDLWSIRTLGFRGEALPSIASVSRLTITTATREEPVGTRLRMTGGAEDKREEVAAAPGTQIEVADLFFNTPARRKFLKATATEFSHICQVVQQAALAWPAVQFRLIHNGQTVLDYPAAASLRDRLLQIYGLRWLDGVMEVRQDAAGLRVEGVTIRGGEARAGRSPQELFVNRRPVKNATASHAIYDAYGSFLAKGRHPQYVLFLDVAPDRVDVNVHPAKREVRFADQELVHQTLRRAIRDALGGSGRSLEVGGDGERPAAAAAIPAGGGWPAPGWGAASRPMPPAYPSHLQPEGQGAVFSPADQLAMPGVQEGTAAYASGLGEVLPLGQISRTFLIAQVGGELQVIDQHTAHERVLFERLWRAWLDRQVAVQPLLIAEPVELPAPQAQLLTRHLPELERLGLSIEPFGAAAFVVRAMPAQLGRLDALSLVQDLVEELAEWTSAASLEARVRPVLASLACHSAVRAGRPMALQESKQLIEDWIREGLPMTCPHGRRIALRLPEEELAKIFGRA